MKAGLRLIIIIVLIMAVIGCQTQSEYDRCVSRCIKGYKIEDAIETMSDEDYAAYKARLRAAELSICPEKCEHLK